MSSTSAVTGIIFDALTDFCANTGAQTPAEWLQGYLGAKLPSQSVEAIQFISGEIFDTLDIMDSKKAAMEEAAAAGKSAETWFTADIMAESGSCAEIARRAAAFLNGITKAENSLDGSVKSEVIDISEESSEWQDENWNDFKLKDTLQGLAFEAGRTALKEIASDVFLKASQDGIAATITDRDFMTNAIANGSSAGLKAAFAAGLAIAESNGLIPVTSVKVTAIIAWKTAESMDAFVDAAMGQATMFEAVVKVKDTAVVTTSGMWAMHKDQILSEAVDLAGNVYGVQGAIIAGALCGLLKETNEPRWIAVQNEVKNAAVQSFTKNINMPFLSKNQAVKLLG